MAYRRWIPAAFCAALVVLCLTSCSSGPSAPQPGTPAFYWGAAGAMWRSGDYLKTLDNLSHLTANQNEFRAKAQPWEVVVALGVARGNLDLSDACDTAIHKSPAMAGVLRRQMSVWRSNGNSTALELADSFHKFAQENKQATIPLEFSWPPAGNATPPPQRDRFAAGSPLSPSDMEKLELAMIQRGVMLTAARAVGAGDDTARGLEVFKQPKPAVSTEVFMTGMAQALYDLSALYGPKQLDLPNRRELLVNLATSAAKPYPKNKDAAALLAKVDKEAKAKGRK
ncbi:MAG TPA: hypothetical protein VMJ34_20610 [Bryobacteraceae bacterium]|nr:hypothetical protein [Bryobacteraceae bacterium]